MAEQQTQTSQATRGEAPSGAGKQEERNLRGGTEAGDLTRAMPAKAGEEGTPDISSGSGGVHIESPADYKPRTDMAARPTEGVPRLGGGKTPEDILGYLTGVDFPALKDTLVRAASRNGAPEDVVAALSILPATEYGSAEQLIRDYPRLPEGGGMELSKGV